MCFRGIILTFEIKDLLLLLSGVIKIEVHTRGAKYTASIEAQRLHQQIEDLQNRNKPRSHQTDRLIAQLREEGVEILSSQLDGETVVVWVWCRSQAAFENIRRLFESNHLRDVFFETIQPSISKMINIDWNEFKKSIGKFFSVRSS